LFFKPLQLQRNDAHLCYVADDSIFLATAISHLCQTSQIVVSFPGLRQKGLQYLQTIAEANGFSVDRQKLQNHQKDSTITHDTHAKKVVSAPAKQIFFPITIIVQSASPKFQL